VGIEVKSSQRWRAEDGRALKELVSSGTVQAAFGVYLGDRPLRDGAVRVLPIVTFLKELAAGRVVPPSQSIRR
jgi:hypothetical protein